MKPSYLFFLTALLCSALSAQAEVLTLRGDIWCPFNCKPGANKEGFMIDMAREIMTKSGHTIEYAELNWSRTLANVREGKFLGAVGASPEDREGILFTKESMGKSQSCFYSKEGDSWTYSGPKSLESKILAIVKDYAYGDEIDDYIKTNLGNPKKIDAITGDDTLPKNTKKVQTGRVDVLLEDKNVVGYHLATSGEKLRLAGCLNSSQDIFIGISKAHAKGPEMVAILDRGISELRKSGKLKEILAKYGVSDWK